MIRFWITLSLHAPFLTFCFSAFKRKSVLNSFVLIWIFHSAWSWNEYLRQDLVSVWFCENYLGSECCLLSQTSAKSSVHEGSSGYKSSGVAWRFYTASTLQCTKLCSGRRSVWEWIYYSVFPRFSVPPLSGMSLKLDGNRDSLRNGGCIIYSHRMIYREKFIKSPWK